MADKKRSSRARSRMTGPMSLPKNGESRFSPETTEPYMLKRTHQDEKTCPVSPRLRLEQVLVVKIKHVFSQLQDNINVTSPLSIALITYVSIG